MVMFHRYVRLPEGKFHSFDLPGAGMEKKSGETQGDMGYPKYGETPVVNVAPKLHVSW